MIERLINKVNQDLVERMQAANEKEPEEVSIMMVTVAHVVRGGPLARAAARKEWLEKQAKSVPQEAWKELRRTGTSHCIVNHPKGDQHVMHEMINIHMTEEGVRKVQELLAAQDVANQNKGNP